MSLGLGALHHFQARSDQPLHEREGDLAVQWKTDNGLRLRVGCEFLRVLFDDGRAEVQADARLLEAKPSKHSVVVVARIRVTWDVEVARCFDGVGRDLSDGFPHFLEGDLDGLRTARNVRVYAAPTLLGAQALLHHAPIPGGPNPDGNKSVGGLG